MKNQNLIIISIVIVTLLEAVGIYAYKSGTKPHPVEIATTSSKSIVPSSSIVSSSLSSQIASSSSSSSVIPAIVLKSSETPKFAVEKPTTQDKLNCNQPDSPDLVKTDDGCFKSGVMLLFTFTNTDLENDGIGSQENPPYTKDLENYYTKVVAKDFYSKIKNQSISKDITITIEGSSKISENKYNLHVSSLDIDYLKQNNMEQTDVGRFNAKYEVNITKPYSFKFLSQTQK
jgi:hypothetical protein